MKKMLALLSLLLLLSVACAEAPDLPTFLWEHDGLHHWQLDEAGAAICQGPHDTADSWLCSVCGAEILDWGDGSFDVTDYDAYGNVLRQSSYDAAGQLAWQSVHALTVNGDGVVLRDVEYAGGVMVSESVYTIGREGKQLPVRTTFRNDDGTTSVNEYDGHGNCIRSFVTEADGSVSFETISEFALNEDGWYYEWKTTSRFSTGETFYDERNEYGDTVRSINTYADGTVWSDTAYEYEYTGGVMTRSRQYSFGVLVYERFCDENGELLREIEYPEDGSAIVTEYEPELGWDEEDPGSAWEIPDTVFSDLFEFLNNITAPEAE